MPTSDAEYWQRPCCVVDCPNEGKRRICPYDGQYHHHGRIHYSCDHPAHSLAFRAGEGWLLICDEHYRTVVAEVAAHKEARGAEVFVTPEEVADLPSVVGS